MNHLYTLVMSIVAVVIWETAIKHTLEVTNYRLRLRFPGIKFAQWLQRRHLARLELFVEEWIHQAEALYIVSRHEYVNDQIMELLHGYDVYVTPDNEMRVIQDARQVRVQLEELNDSVPKRILDRFVDQNPLSYQDGMYCRQSLIIWLRSDERNWAAMLAA